MHHAAVTATLCLLILAGLCLWMLGECADRMGGNSPEAWLDDHGEEAEKVALRALGGESLELIPRSRSLRDSPTRIFPGAVSFAVPAWDWLDTIGGMCYSPSGEAPPLGWGDEPPDRWEHVRGNWYHWADD